MGNSGQRYESFLKAIKDTIGESLNFNNGYVNCVTGDLSRPETNTTSSANSNTNPVWTTYINNDYNYPNYSGTAPLNGDNGYWRTVDNTNNLIYSPRPHWEQHVGYYDTRINNYQHYNKFKCFPSSTDRISENRRDIIYKMFSITKLGYLEAIKHLGIETMLFNTLLMEYALEHKRSVYMQLFSSNSMFTAEDLYSVVVSYK